MCGPPSVKVWPSLGPLSWPLSNYGPPRAPVKFYGPPGPLLSPPVTRNSAPGRLSCSTPERRTGSMYYSRHSRGQGPLGADGPEGEWAWMTRHAGGGRYGVACWLSDTGKRVRWWEGFCPSKGKCLPSGRRRALVDWNTRAGPPRGHGVSRGWCSPARPPRHYTLRFHPAGQKTGLRVVPSV